MKFRWSGVFRIFLWGTLLNKQICCPAFTKTKNLYHSLQILYTFNRNSNWNFWLGLCILCACPNICHCNTCLVVDCIWFACHSSTHWKSWTGIYRKLIGWKNFQKKGKISKQFSWWFLWGVVRMLSDCLSSSLALLFVVKPIFHHLYSNEIWVRWWESDHIKWSQF